VRGITLRFPIPNSLKQQGSAGPKINSFDFTRYVTANVYKLCQQKLAVWPTL